MEHPAKMPEEIALLLMSSVMETLQKDYADKEELSTRLAEICSLVAKFLRENNIVLGEGYLALCVLRDQTGYKILEKLKNARNPSSGEWFKDLKIDDSK